MLSRFVVAIVSDPEDAEEVVKIKQMNGIRPTHVRRVMIFFSVNFFFLIPFLPIGPVMFKDPELKKSFPALKLDEVRLISSVCFAYCPEFILTGSFS